MANMGSIGNTESYIHGFSSQERNRPIEQATALAPAVFGGLDFSEFEDLLEVGCGVGAQTKHILGRWPNLKVCAIDKNTSQVSAARDYLAAEIASGRVRLLATDISICIPDRQFDAALTIWVLEHVSDPAVILMQIQQALKPGGYLVLTEVDNATFGFFPENLIIERWWDQFNTFQASGGANPFIGQTLDTLAKAAGFAIVSFTTLPIIDSDREPERRIYFLRYLRDLLLSGAENLRNAGIASHEDELALRQEFERIELQPDVRFQYFAKRLIARKI